VSEKDKYEALKLKNQLCFPLYACSKEVVRLYKPFLDEIDLTYTQYITMMVMWERKEINVKELGECLYLDSGTLTPVLKKLEVKGYITRNHSKIDERSVMILLTEDGEALKDKALTVPERVGKCLKLDVEEIGVLYKLLYKIINQIK
jgi:DNA-binding MarR family transcriptional regulator